MINCPNCGRENEDEYKYCLGCGSVLPRVEAAAPPPSDTSHCSNCGTEIPPNFKFCGACGTPVKASPISGATNPPVVPPREPTSPQPAATAAGQVAQLVVIRPDGTEGAKIPIRAGEVRLGRSSDYEVLASDPFLSPHHATLVVSNGTFTIRDAGSLNGVFFRITSEVELQDGDLVRVGQELLEFHLTTNLEPIIARSNDDKTLTTGAPDAGYWGRLALVGGPDLETRAFVFAGDEVTLGREVGDILFRDDGFVSGRHAKLAKVQGRVMLKDLGSSNGTYVRIRGERRVEDGDLILMGQQLFRLEA